MPGIHAALLKKSPKKRRRKKQKGGAERRRRILRDNISGVTKPAIKRLARRAGVKRVSGLIYEEVRGILKVHLEDLVRKAALAMNMDRLRTLKPRHVHYALQNMDSFMAGLKAGEQLVRMSGGAKRKSPHRFRPGTVALREIKKLQKKTNLLLAKEPFRRLVREVLQDFVDDANVSEQSFHLIQSESENYLVKLLREGNLSAIHGGRITLYPKDLQIARRIRGERY
jgi:histone H3/H4